jgi:hypothetical protein
MNIMDSNNFLMRKEHDLNLHLFFGLPIKLSVRCAFLLRMATILVSTIIALSIFPNSLFAQTTEPVSPATPRPSIFRQKIPLVNGEVPAKYRAIYESARKKRLEKLRSEGITVDANTPDPVPEYTFPVASSDGTRTKVQVYLQYLSIKPKCSDYAGLSSPECAPMTYVPYVFIPGKDGDTNFPESQKAKPGVDYEDRYYANTDYTGSVQVQTGKFVWNGDIPTGSSYTLSCYYYAQLNCPQYIKDSGKQRSIAFYQYLINSPYSDKLSKTYTAKTPGYQWYYIDKNVTSDKEYITITYYTPVEIVVRQFIPSPAVALKFPPRFPFPGEEYYPNSSSNRFYRFMTQCNRIPAPYYINTPGCHVKGDSRSFYPDKSGFSRYYIYAIVTADPTLLDPVISSEYQWCYSGNYRPTDTSPVSMKPTWWRSINPGAPLLSHGKIEEHPGKNIFLGVERLPDKSIELFTKADAHDPIIPAPYLQGYMHINISQQIGQPPKVSITGKSFHTRFPAMEVYANEQKLYTYDPVAEGGSPFDLLGSFFDIVYPRKYLTNGISPVEITPQNYTSTSIPPVCDVEPTTPNQNP